MSVKDETFQPEFALHSSPTWSSTADYAESKHVGVTCRAGAENCVLVLVSPEDYLQVKSSAHGRACHDDRWHDSHISRGVAAAVVGYPPFVVCCVYLVL